VNDELEGVEKEKVLMGLSRHHAPLLYILRKTTTNLRIAEFVNVFVLSFFVKRKQETGVLTPMRYIM
jgi:hypothetical protein